MKKLLFTLLSLYSISTHTMFSKRTSSLKNMPQSSVKTSKLLKNRKYYNNKVPNQEQIKSEGYYWHITPLTEKELELRSLNNEIAEIRNNHTRLLGRFRELNIKRGMYTVGLPTLATIICLSSNSHWTELSFTLPIIASISWVDYEKTIQEMHELDYQEVEMNLEYPKLLRKSKELLDEIGAERDAKKL